MRYSRQRELILKKVTALDNHPTAEQIYQLASSECPGLSLGTVYRNLNGLAEAGRIRRVSVPGGPDRFDHTLYPHSHLCCTKCGGVSDVLLDEKQVMALFQASASGVEGYSLTLFGLCEGCRRKAGC